MSHRHLPLKRILLIIIACVCAWSVQAEEVEKKNPFAFYQPFYEHSGYHYVSLLTVGYSTVFLLPNNPMGYDITEFTGRQHFLNASFIDFRIRFLGAELLNFDFGVNTPGRTKHGVGLPVIGNGADPALRADSIAKGSMGTMWFAWKPCLKFYIPATKWLAGEVYVGAEVDITTLWSQVAPKYYKPGFDPAWNHFVGGFGGIGLLFAGKIGVPIELKCEYRCPSKGNRALVPEGFYLSAQFHIGWMLNEKGKVLNK